MPGDGAGPVTRRPSLIGVGKQQLVSRPWRAGKRLYRSLPGLASSGLALHLQQRYRDRPPTRLDVMTSFAGPNLDVVQVMLHSLSRAHPLDQIVFWLLEQDIPAPQIQALAEFGAGLGNVELRPIRIEDAAAFARLRDLGGKPDSARFLWFMAHRHLPQDLARAIYLDANDILVSDDLVPFLNHPFLDRYLVACRELIDLPPLVIGPARRAHAWRLPHKFLRHVSRGLMNSGAIVLNLDKFRRDDIGIGHYLNVAEWAHDRLGLRFGDQGLFSLTHGSHYMRAHDRFNHRFYDESPHRAMQRPAVIHFAGKVLKPAYWRLTERQEQQVTAHIAQSGNRVLKLTDGLELRVSHLPYLRRWWDTCAQTPCHGRIEPLARQRMTALLERLGIGSEPG